MSDKMEKKAVQFDRAESDKRFERQKLYIDFALRRRQLQIERIKIDLAKNKPWWQQSVPWLAPTISALVALLTLIITNSQNEQARIAELAESRVARSSEEKARIAELEASRAARESEAEQQIIALQEERETQIILQATKDVSLQQARDNILFFSKLGYIASKNPDEIEKILKENTPRTGSSDRPVRGLRALSLRSNVVYIETSWSHGRKSRGFGFIVGERGDMAYIVTARPVIRHDNINAEDISVQLFGLTGQVFDADLVDLPTKADDFGVITFDWPEEIPWRQDALAPSEDPLEFGDSVWFIGRYSDWYVPARPGIVNEFSRVARRIWSDELPLNTSSVGAPLLSINGIVGMITGSVSPLSGRGTPALPISEI